MSILITASIGTVPSNCVQHVLLLILIIKRMSAHASIEIKILMDSGFFEHNLKPTVSSLNFV